MEASKLMMLRMVLISSDINNSKLLSVYVVVGNNRDVINFFWYVMFLSFLLSLFLSLSLSSILREKGELCHLFASRV